MTTRPGTAFRTVPLSAAVVRPMRPDDVPAVVDVHQAVFSGYFLSVLGQKFLQAYYVEFVAQKGAFGFVAVEGGEVVGFIVGVLDAASFYRRLYRRRFFQLGAIVIAGAMQSRALRNELWSRISHLRYAVASLVGEQAGKAVFEHASETSTRLLAIGVSEQARGRGIAEALVDDLCIAVRRAGAARMGLSVRPTNDRAIAFYIRNGWQKEAIEGGDVYFVRSTAPARGPVPGDVEQLELDRIRTEYARRMNDLRLASRYDALDRGSLFVTHGRERAIFDVLRSHGVGSLDTAHVLDLGCGTGGDLARLCSYGADRTTVVGVDLLFDRLTVAHGRHPHLGFVQAEGGHLPFDEAVFDVVLQSTVVSSILDGAMRRLVAAEMLRVLKPGGLVVWYDFWWNPTNPATRGIRAGEIRALFPGCAVRLRRVTLAPPLARRVAGVSWTAAHALQALPMLRTHYCAAILKPVKPAA